MSRFLFILAFILLCSRCIPQQTVDQSTITPGAWQTGKYLPDLRGKNVGLLVNHTSRVGQRHLVDTLIDLDIQVTKVFSPEHGFRGKAPDGQLIEQEEAADTFDLISLYGSSKKPSGDQLSGLDVLIVDLQDVGVRCYTYASTMTYMMEACAAASIPVIILDRPNPNGRYVDGPVLDTAFRSFVGLHPIPLVHGLTLGELATMINEEGWLPSGLKCSLQVITVKNWEHDTPYVLPIPPSPNLPNELAVALYPSLVLFEGTSVSVGRGTDLPFQVVGHPEFSKGTYQFTPQPNAASKYPPKQGLVCHGFNLSDLPAPYTFSLSWLLTFYKELNGPGDDAFFTSYFDLLAGTDSLRKQILSGLNEAEIRKTWKPELTDYLLKRKKYLLYEE